MGHDVRGEKEEMYSNCGVLLFNISQNGRYFAGKSGNTMEINLKFEDVNSLARDALAFYDERIFLIDNLHKIDLEDVMRLDFYIACCCLSGKASLFLGGEPREVRPDELLICHPGIVVERSMLSLDFEGFGIGLSKEYVRQLLLLLGSNWEREMYLERNPILRLTAQEMERLAQYYALLHTKLAGGRGYYEKEIADALLQAMLYELGAILRRFEPGNLRAAYSSGESLFQRFMGLLSSVYPRPRLVAWYAEELHVSPKYLSAVCRQVGGETASAIVNRYVLNDVKTLLRQPNKGIKEIAYELDFPDLSFFGRYVKKNLGVSPRQFREQALLARAEGGGME